MLKMNLAFSLCFLMFSMPTWAASTSAKSLYQFEVTTNGGKKKSLSEYKGKALLIVNTASKCGYTKQYAGLQKIYEKYQPLGLEILAFPSNDFNKQEPGTAKEIKSFCELNYNIKFPIFEKNPVSGKTRQPLFSWLVENDPATRGQPVEWNFEKFVVSKNGKVIERFKSKVEPESHELISAIETALE